MSSGFPSKTPGRDKPGRKAGTSRSGGKPPARGAARAAAPARPPVLGAGGHALIETTVTGLGYALVDVERAARGLLRVTIDRVPGRSYEPAGDFVTVEDCEAVTRQLQYALEVDGLDYARLEVSSPGLDRPLKTEVDYERFAGEAIDLTLKAPFQGRKHWQGRLLRAEAGWSLVFMDGKTEQVLGFAFDEVREARLVPVVNFKGRAEAKARTASPAAEAADVGGTEE